MTQGAFANYITENTVHSNTPYDLEQYDATTGGCVGVNMWYGNVFYTVGTYPLANDSVCIGSIQ
jgi:hypothetical protein